MLQDYQNLTAQIADKNELENQLKSVQNMRYNLQSGQQCITDLFLCLQQNVISWPDVCFLFNFTISHRITCCKCEHSTEYETTQMHVEMDVPSNNSNLNDAVEEMFNINSLLGRVCHDGCKSLAQAEVNARIKLVKDTEFFIVILRRAGQTLDGFKLIDNKVNPRNKVLIR